VSSRRSNQLSYRSLGKDFKTPIVQRRGELTRYEREAALLSPLDTDDSCRD
jgi:hypothetical protein